ncbi:DUF1800 domain-containing protein [Yoonia sp. BS5-3]|uniref:DUF1800 domain-containing protein n=1 Tax=Yoonia phaeophyticola TaxID=3137369 RepID=A0ABZ2V9Z7_9RHOB
MKAKFSSALAISPLLLAAMGFDASAQTLTATNQGSVSSLTSQEEALSSKAIVINIAVDGTYVITVPETSNFALKVDGVRLVEPSGLQLTAITSLVAGTHVVEIEGSDLPENSFDLISIHQSGFFQEVSLSAITASGEDESLETALANVRPNNSGSNEGLRVATNIGNILAIGRGLQNPEEEPVNFGSGALVSPLAPPVNATVTEAIQIVSGGTEDGLVASTGQTLFGRVQDYLTYDIVNVTIQPSGRETTVSVGPNRGGFAIRLFDEDLSSGAASVTISAGSSEDDTLSTEAVTYDYIAAELSDGLSMTLSRATFGATPALYSRVRAIGYRAYLEEQFNPDSIDDSLFESLNADMFLWDTNGALSAASGLRNYNLARAVYSEKQLQEVTGLFWSNHFHAANKMSYVVVQAYDDRQFYRDNAFGNFEDMLLYSARSPLMSQFLDNDESVVGNLNENYAREILELHTVGADAGYGDDDIIAVARVFTGWNYTQTNVGTDDARKYEFTFHADRHDAEDKYIPFLDVTIQGRSGEAGVEEGEELIALLADDPRTHAYVCGKIVQWFVADEPPQNFIDMCTEAWADSDGNSEAMLRAVLLSPEFVSTPEILRAKGKNPLEYAASFLRATGAELYEMAPTGTGNGDDWGTWARYSTAQQNSGYDPAGFDLPTGLDEVGASWANSAVMTAMYNAPELTIANRINNAIYIEDRMAENGLETPEELAAYLLAIATTDHYRRDEFEAVLNVLQISGEPFVTDSVWSSRAIHRALAITHIIPSFSLQ